jgi:hypothetical protein
MLAAFGNVTFAVFFLANKTKEMHKYRILFQLLHLHVSVYMTIFRVLTEYISAVKCKRQYICIYSGMM